MLAALLAAHYGKPYPRVAEERILRRLGLRHTWIGPTNRPAHHRVTSYLGRDGHLAIDTDIAWPDYACGHAGVYLTLDDLGRFLDALVAGELVARDALRRFWQPRALRGGRRGVFATGWEVGRSGTFVEVGHDGGTRDRVRILFDDSLDGDTYTFVDLTNGNARNVWSRTLLDSVMAVSAPGKFPQEALSERLTSYALSAPEAIDPTTAAAAVRTGSRLEPAGALVAPRPKTPPGTLGPDLLRQPDQDALGSAQIAEPVGAGVVDHLVDDRGAEPAEAREGVVELLHDDGDVVEALDGHRVSLAVAGATGRAAGRVVRTRRGGARTGNDRSGWA